jgi:oligopeptide transport system substrate-binding protein
VLLSLLLPLLAFAADLTTIRIQISTDPRSLDPVKIEDQIAYSIASNTVEGLFRVDENGKLQNGLVASYRVSKDGKRYSLRLRKDAVWSDGKPVTLEDCVLGLRHGIDPDSAASDAELLFGIRGAKKIFSREASKETLGVSKQGEELVVELERPDSVLPYVLSMPLTAPVRKDFLDKFQGKWNTGYPVTGKYRVSKYELEKEVLLEPNPARKDTAGLHPIQLKIIASDTAALNLFESGKLDVISTIPATELGRMRQLGRVDSSLGTTVFFLAFNVAKKPFDDPLWRKALAGAVEREQLAKVLNGFYEPSTAYIPKKIDGHAPIAARFEKEVTLAREQKAKPEIFIEYSGTAMNNTVMEKLKNDIERKLGTTISLRPSESKAYSKRLDTDPPALYYSGMGAPYNDSLNHLFLFSSSKAQNRSRYVSAEYEKMVEKVRSLPLGKARIAATQEAQKILVERDAVVVPLLERTQLYGVGASVKGFRVNPYNVIALDKLRKAE